MYPMVITRERQQYEPMVLRDVTGIMDKMPPLHRGGKVWLSKFLALMSGQSCTLGDLRQILAGSCSLVQLQAIEEAAGTADLGRETPLPRVAGQLFEQIKITFPQPTDLAPTMFPCDIKMSPAQHYVTCVESWIGATGRHPALSAEVEVLFWMAIVDGLLQEVKKHLKSDPDILVCAEARFKPHLVHHWRAFCETQVKVDSEGEALSKQLIKLQLAKIHGEAKQSKVQKREMQMVQGPQVQGPQVQGRGRPVFRCGLRGRGRSMLGLMMRPQYQPQLRDACFICGAPDHWARECPQQQQQGRRPPQGPGGVPFFSGKIGCAPLMSPTSDSPIDHMHSWASFKNVSSSSVKSFQSVPVWSLLMKPHNHSECVSYGLNSDTCGNIKHLSFKACGSLTLVAAAPRLSVCR
ncbi:uncharacterized protein LOC133492909 [Syngnathoides biaculeatus]|uniref:uncharacterized protein LOC133492909 n=1 Tax=Syngnathoides biaculeatus TaxID=300417 RepID=UPI002ADD5A92|nr:uncharacterized protein LOC133492909 [Syngnathoides biaculeatus]XP_061661728.1 uncharacterized protein LOC133492909 [Syngnathoides biaculeatus]